MPQLVVNTLELSQVAINLAIKQERFSPVHYCIPYQCYLAHIQIPSIALCTPPPSCHESALINGIYGNSQAHYFYFSHVHVSLERAVDFKWR